MNPLNLGETSAPDSLPKWLPPVGGLLAASAVACLMCRLPLPQPVSWGGLIGSAAERLLAVFLASAVTVWGLGAIRPGASVTNARPLILRTSLDALWLAPLALFTCANSAWAMAIAAVLVASVTKSFQLLGGHSEEADTEKSLVLWLNSNTFSLSDSSLWFWRLFPAVCAALCAQTAALAGFTGYPVAAATLVGISSAIWTLSFTAANQPDNLQFRVSKESLSRVLLALVLVFVFTAAGLTRYMQNTRRFGGLGVPSTEHSRHGFSPWERRGQVGHEKTPEGPATDLGEAYSGIVLWPKKKQTYTTLVAPAPVLGNSWLRNNRSANPLVIPFDGVYLFFKAPEVHPPRGSREAHGSPEMLDIRSTDRRPLSMEAHQNFGTMIDVDCCSRIQIGIRNADRYTETVSLELILINTSLPGKPSQSLGRIMVKSTRPWKLYDDRPPAAEVLNFDIPANPALRRFDEVMIVFRLDADRADAGAKIAIERFVLVPRGL